MQRVSTNATLFYKFFVPIFWIVFFGSVTLAIWLSGRTLFGEIPGPTLRWGSLLFYSSGVLLFVFTVFRLKRVEVSVDHVFVTDYFRTVRYPWHDIERITEQKFLFLRLVTVHLKAPGRFGRRLPFVASNKLYADAKQELQAAGKSEFFVEE